MKIQWRRFNTYLFLIFFALGCQTPQEKKKGKEFATLALHVEVQSGSTASSGAVYISRDHPTAVVIDQTPIVDTGNLRNAEVIEVMGGFAIRLMFDAHATLVLDQLTTSIRGRRIAVLVQFPEARWLAAPLIRERIVNGVISFTPDATREEAEKIVLGLNNTVKKLKSKNRPFNS